LKNDRVIAALMRHFDILNSLFQMVFKKCMELSRHQPGTFFCCQWHIIKSSFLKKGWENKRGHWGDRQTFGQPKNTVQKKLKNHQLLEMTGS
jgi:hypothetical protein